MVESLSRELILPAVRLDVPARPSDQQVAALAERSPDAWTVAPRDLATQQVARLAVAAVLQARLADVDAAEGSEPPTMAQLARLFRPHVSLSAQAFQIAVVESVNAGVPAAADPLREGLRRIGVTGREPTRMLALGLDKVPARAASEFWVGAKGSTTLTAVVDALAAGARRTEKARDVSGLDRSAVARADALVLAGGRTTAVSLGTRPREGGSWLPVPLAVTRSQRGRTADEGRRGGGDQRGGDRPLEIGLRAEGWSEVFETALDAVSAAMQQIDLGSRPRGPRAGVLAEALAMRLAAAKDRSAADVVASLRDIDPFALELFDHQVSTTVVRVAVPVLEDERFVQLWLPTSGLAGPLLTGAVDLFLGGGVDSPPRAKASGKPGSGKPDGRPARPQGERDPRPRGGRPSRRGGGKGGRPAAGDTSPAPEESAPEAPAPSPAPEGPTPAPLPIAD